MADRSDDPPSQEPGPFTPPAAPGQARMTPEGTLNTALLAYAALKGIFGLAMLLFPRALWVVVGGAAELYDTAYTSTRFAGGAMVALAAGALLLLRKPEGRGTLFTVLTLEATMVAVGAFITIAADEAPTSLWFEWLVALGSAALAGFLCWARVRGRKVLRGG